MTDTLFLVLRWEAWLGLTIFSVLLTVGALFLLIQRRPGWQPMRRRLIAASLAPLLIFVGVVIAVVLVVRGPGDGWADLARAAVFTGAVQLAVVSLFVGLVTAWGLDLLTQDGESSR
ncbi:MAG TPA: hypothetical protein VM913_06620 [Sphingomicrobium sp.]|jgi:hypothetical protein|nr:hypothetical protein [Sphingomicrobium sp.]